MTKVKAVVLKNKVGKDGLTNIKIRLTHSNDSCEIRTPYYVDPKHMGADGLIKSTHSGYKSLNTALSKIILEYNNTIQGLGPDVDSMDINTLARKLKRNEETGSSFIKYADERIKELTRENRLSYATTYVVTLVHLKVFLRSDELLFKEITPDFLQKFEKYLLMKGCKVNTVRIYLNNIRAIYNHAVENDVIKEGFSPFRKFRVKQERPRKRAAELIDIKKIMTGPFLPAQQRSVDVFMLIFYLAGINLKDLLYLRPSNIKDGFLNYKRLKLVNKQEVDLRIKLIPEAIEIIERYRGKKYLLRFLDEDDSYDHYKNFLRETNKRLRMAGEFSGVKSYLSTYVARHSWATLAYGLGISKSDIDLSLGHNLNSMTDQYIDYSTLFARIDKANKKVVSKLHSLALS